MSTQQNGNTNDYVLEARNITKHYNGVLALDNVTLKLRRGEVLGLVGDNGAGKSTLIKIISGAILMNSGEIFLNNQKIKIKNPIDALNFGIYTVYQNLALVDTMDAVSNIFLGKELRIGKFILNKRKMYNESTNLMSRLNIDIGILRKEMSSYSGGQRQAVALSKAIYWGNKIIILDEPTAALGQKESKSALKLVKTLKEYGMSVIIISHNLQHVFSLVDRVMVLRRGKCVGVKNIHKTKYSEIVTMITGAEEYQERI